MIRRIVCCLQLAKQPSQLKFFLLWKVTLQCYLRNFHDTLNSHSEPSNNEHQTFAQITYFTTSANSILVMQVLINLLAMSDSGEKYTQLAHAAVTKMKTFLWEEHMWDSVHATMVGRLAIKCIFLLQSPPPYRFVCVESYLDETFQANLFTDLVKFNDRPNLHNTRVQKKRVGSWAASDPSPVRSIRRLAAYSDP